MKQLIIALSLIALLLPSLYANERKVKVIIKRPRPAVVIVK